MQRLILVGLFSLALPAQEPFAKLETTVRVDKSVNLELLKITRTGNHIVLKGGLIIDKAEQKVRTLEGLKPGYSFSEVSPAGQYVLFRYDTLKPFFAAFALKSVAKVIEQPLATLTGAPLNVSPRDTYCAYVTDDNILQLYGLSKLFNKKLKPARVLKAGEQSCLFSPQENMVVTACAENALDVWGLPHGFQMKSIEGRLPCFNATGDTLAVVHKNSIDIYNTKDFSLIARKNSDEPIGDVQLSPSQSRFRASNSSGSQLWSIDKGKFAHFKHGKIVVAPNHSTVVEYGKNGIVKDLLKDTSWELDPHVDRECLTFDPLAHYILIKKVDHAELRKLNDGTLLQVMPNDHKQANFSGDGSYLITVNEQAITWWKLPKD